jgi:hypothetical protein
MAKEDLRKKRIENDKAQLELYKAKIELGVAIIEQYAPELSEQERLMYIHKLLKPLNVLGESRLEIESGV